MAGSRGRVRRRVKPPPIPQGEDPQVTISNQNIQIDILLDRIAKLTRDLEVANAQLEMQRGLAAELGKLQSVVNRMEGWKDCAREVLGSIELPLTR